MNRLPKEARGLSKGLSEGLTAIDQRSEQAVASKGGCSGNDFAEDAKSMDASLDPMKLPIPPKRLGKPRTVHADPKGKANDMAIYWKATDDEILAGDYDYSSSETSGDDVKQKMQPHGHSVDEDSPEAVIRKDTRYLRIMRGLVIFGLISVAAAAVTFIYLYTSTAEDEAFRNDFDGIASRIVDSFLLDTRFKFSAGRTTATMMTGLMEAGSMTHLNLTLPSFDEITRAQRFVSFATMVAWSPFLKTLEEKETFEWHAALQELTRQNSTESTVDLKPPCYFCGSADRGFTNPDALVTLAGFANEFTCGELDRAGRDGVVIPQYCKIAESIVLAQCECGPKLETENVVDTTERSWADGVFRIDDLAEVVDEDSSPPYHPIWLQSSVFEAQSSIMYNQYSEKVRANALMQMTDSTLPIMSETFFRQDDFYDLYGGNVPGPFVALFYPVFGVGVDTETIVGSITSEFGFRGYIQSIYPPRSDLVDIVVENSCGQFFTFKIVDEELTMVEDGDGHDTNYPGMAISSTFEDFERIVSLSTPVSGDASAAFTAKYCRYRFHVHATSELADEFKTREPFIFACIAAAIFFLTSTVFILYDCLVIRRQRKVMETARRNSHIVSSLFPKAFRSRLYEENKPHVAKSTRSNGNSEFARRPSLLAPKTRLKTFLEDEPQPGDTSEPIADLFPESTIMFLDIVGFTAWSSEREPAQVFTLLETLYAAFDRVAEKLGVFKIETIGDSYVAVSGVPEPCSDHALVMARFAYRCMKRLDKLTKQLEVKLGPSTGELKGRCGLHSGPVTAGVLRGQKARFQLFGDTMNTAARMESNGVPDRIQASKATADLLTAGGKGEWVIPRSELITAKGKGKMQTYWIDPSKRRTDSARNSTKECLNESFLVSEFGESEVMIGENLPDLDLTLGLKAAESVRLVEWNVEVLYQLLQQIANTRQAAHPRSTGSGGHRPRLSRGGSFLNIMSGVATCDDEMDILDSGRTVLEECAEVIETPRFDNKAARRLTDTDNGQLGSNVRAQLREYVMRIASMYRNVPFHNFEHASHVTMSASKLLKRIVRPDSIDNCSGGNENNRKEQSVARKIHESTYGISSDPLMQFATVFAALIHDVDHTGLPNSQLIHMQTSAAIIYKNKSVAEQNSVDVAWTVLMDQDFDELRAAIYSSRGELKRFRQLVVNAVMATDIADRQLQALRKKRWEKAFAADSQQHSDQLFKLGGSNHGGVDHHHLKATIVFEYIIQASDVAHTMQHWQTYQKWNERLFQERYAAFVAGKEAHDPVDGWYEGEIAFFDNYAIPLNEKLKQCGVFGASSDELLSWALQNRQEWQDKGRELVQAMHERAVAKYSRSDKK